MEGVFASTEFPHFLSNMPHSYQGDPELGQAIAEAATKNGTLIPLRYLALPIMLK